jgi:hypothetical protein
MASDSSLRTPAARRRIAVGIGLAVIAAAALALFFVPRASGGGIGPDVTVYSLDGVQNFGAVGGVRAYAIGTRSCNQGDVPLNWCDEPGGCGGGTTDEDHPVIAQNLYRLKDGRFEQIGMSWLKHGFTALQISAPGCGTGSCQATNGNFLGVGCTDPYSTGLNGSRPLGLRSEVNAASGEFPFPYTEIGSNDIADQRMQVRETDLDPSQNPGALYWIEGQYVAPDDAAAGNGLNNASYQAVTVNGTTFNISASGPTVQELPAIAAWQVVDPLVELMPADVPSTPVERFHVARKVTDLGGGSFHYEYAIHNLNSDRSARSFTVDFPGAATISNAGFHDVDHHSGEPYATTDWTIDTSTPGAVIWSTLPFATDANANALRWGTMFSFWFDATAPPAGIGHTIGLFKPGSPADIQFSMAAGIFEDGFESGNTTVWSSTTP